MVGARRTHRDIASLAKCALNVQVPPDLYEAARRFAFDNRISLAEVVRLGVSKLVGLQVPSVQSRRAKPTAKKR